MADEQPKLELDRGLFHIHTLNFQADTIHGFRFFDDSGRILNKYVDLYEDWTNGLDGTQFSKPKEDGLADSIRVDAQKIWLHFVQPASLAGPVGQILSVLRDVSRLIDV